MSLLYLIFLINSLTSTVLPIQNFVYFWTLLTGWRPYCLLMLINPQMRFMMPYIFAFWNLYRKCLISCRPFQNGFHLTSKRFIFSKKQAHAKYKASQCPNDYDEFSALRSSYKAEYKKCYKAFLLRTESSLKANPRSFRNFVREQKSNNGIPHSVHLDNLQSSGTESVSNLFSTYFNTVYVPPLPDDFSSPFLFHDLPSKPSSL